jgi:hypothetical protein
MGSPAHLRCYPVKQFKWQKLAVAGEKRCVWLSPSCEHEEANKGAYLVLGHSGERWKVAAKQSHREFPGSRVNNLSGCVYGQA